MNKREYKDYLQDISDAIDAIEQFTHGLSKKEFIEDLKTLYASIRAIGIIGEAANKVPESFRNKHPEIPWRDMADMRNVLMHEYFGVDMHTVWETVQKDIPQLKVSIAEILKDFKDE